jgi:hypothetical protein
MRDPKFYASYYVKKPIIPASELSGALRKGARWAALPLAERFWACVDKSGDCWTWTGYRTPRGYGRLQRNGVGLLAHRVSYELEHGSIPAGLHVCHHCDNPSCVRPSHLFLGDAKANLADMTAKGRRRSNPPVGEAHSSSKLTAAIVVDVLRLRGVVPQRDLAKRYGVVKSTIANIHRGTTWKHLKEATS